MDLLPWTIVPLAVLAYLLMLRVPGLARGTFIVLVVILAVGLVLVSGPDRAVAPLALVGLALALLLPEPAQSSVRRRSTSARVAPRRRPTSAAGSARKTKGKAKQTSSFEDAEVPGYEILERVGSGGMAQVYRARRRADGQIVALKLPMEQYVADAKFIRRFHREAEVAQRLDHVNIVRTYEHGSQGVRHFMAMEFVDGRSLESYIDAKELDIELSGEIMRLVADALGHIHAAGIVHRDIKPANIMILRGGIQKGPGPRLAHDAVKLMDFGIAGGKVLSRLTMTGARVGTPVYMSPEQARGLKIDHRSDIYSLGLVFYEMLTGETAFKGGYEAIVHQQIFQQPAPPRQLNLKVNRELDDLVMRMLAKDPEERPSLQDVIDFLERRSYEEEVAPELPNRLVVTVSSKQGVVRVLDTRGSLHASLGDIGLGPREFSAAPAAIAPDGRGNLYAVVFEYRQGQSDHRMIRKLDGEGDLLMAFGTYGMKPGDFLQPVSLSVAPDGSLYVLDAETFMVQRFDGDGQYVLGFGGRGEGRGTFAEPRVVTVGPDGSVYVLDQGNRQVQKFTAEGKYVTRWAFRAGGDASEMRQLDGLAVDGASNVYISDATAGRIRKISPDAKILQSFSFDTRQGESAEGLMDMGVDDQGNLYAARRGGHLIRKLAPDGSLITTIETYAPLVQMAVDVLKKPAAAD